jgi:Fur family ferric uptake transcriptional regulator
MVSHQPEVERLKTFLSAKNLRWTSQRQELLESFLNHPGHLSAENLHRQTPAGRKMGFATVYRTLKHLVACGLAREVDLGDGTLRFEKTSSNKHHDHLLCVTCGAIEEFLNPRIENLQEKVAQDHGFQITHHHLMLYGQCPRCQKDDNKKAPIRFKTSIKSKVKRSRT